MVSAKEAHINAHKTQCQPLFGFDLLFFHLTKFNSEIIVIQMTVYVSNISQDSNGFEVYDLVY